MSRAILALALVVSTAAANGPAVVRGQELDATSPQVHPALYADIVATTSLEDIMAPFAGAGRPTVMVTRDDAATTDNVHYEELVESLESGLPSEASAAAAAVSNAGMPISLALRFHFMAPMWWPAAVRDIVEPYGESNVDVRAAVDQGINLEAFLSAPGASARPKDDDLGDVLIVQLHGKNDWAFDGKTATLAPGDALVLPSGTISQHRAAADGPSLHLMLHRIGEGQTSIDLRERLNEERRQLSHYSSYFDHPDYSDEKQCYPKTRAYCKCPCDQCSFCTNDNTVCDEEVPCGYKKGGLDACCQESDYRRDFDNDDEVCRRWNDKFLYPEPPKCQDSKSWYYIAGDKGPKGCDHVKEDRKRCKNRGFVGAQTGKGIKAEDACPEACFKCGDLRDDFCGNFKGDSISSSSSEDDKKEKGESFKRKKCKKGAKDSKSWTYDAGGNGRVGCKHVSEKPENRCARIGGTGKTLTTAKDECCATCADYDCTFAVGKDGSCKFTGKGGSSSKEPETCADQKKPKDDSKFRYKGSKCKDVAKAGQCSKKGTDKDGNKVRASDACCKSCGADAKPSKDDAKSCKKDDSKWRYKGLNCKKAAKAGYCKKKGRDKNGDKAKGTDACCKTCKDA